MKKLLRAEIRILTIIIKKYNKFYINRNRNKLLLNISLIEIFNKQKYNFHPNSSIGR